MPNYKYRARDRFGKDTSGSVQAADTDELRRILRTNELYLVGHKGGGPLPTTDQTAPKMSIFDAKPKLQDMVIAIRQLGTMMRSGIPIVQALEIVGAQSNKPALRSAFLSIEKDVVEGNSLSVSMKKHPKIFNPLVQALVEAGEISGTLAHTLEVAATQLDREDDLRRRVKGATFYPKMVVGAAVGTVTLMLVLVVPVFASVYGSLHAKLPAATLFLIWISEVIVHYWWMVAILAVAATYAFKQYRKTAPGQLNIDKLILKLPVFGPLMRKIAIARFVQTLAGCMRGGVGVVRSLVISGETAGNVIIRDAVMETAQSVVVGSTIAAELDKSKQFPIMVTRMIAAGEASGNIDEMLDEINRFYDRDVQHSVDQLTRMIEPAMTILLGGIVLVILLALYMPIFNLGQAFRDSK